MFRSTLVILAVVCFACGPLTPPKPDAGGGGGGGSLFGGGTGGGNGGGTSGGGTGGGIVTGGGTGGGTTGGGTGGGATGGGGGGALAPLTWASMTINGGTSTSYIVGLGGTSTDLWAIQDTGPLFHSTGGAFTFQFSIQYGAKDLYAADGTVVIVQTRSIRTCTANCTTEAAFADYSLLNGSFNLFGEAVCGRGANDITVVVSDTSNAGQLFHWDGNMWTRTNVNLGVDYPRACWFDDAGVLYVVGRDVVIRSDSGASTTETLSTNLTGYYGGGDVVGTSWVVGPNHYVARRTGTTWTPFSVSTTSTLWAVGGLSENEVYAFGYYESSAGNGFKWNGTALTPVGNLLPNTGSQSSIRTMLVTAPNELFVAGSNQAGPIIIRGRR